MARHCGRLPAAPRKRWVSRPLWEGITMSSEQHTGESPGSERPATRQPPDLSRRSVIRGAGLAGAGLAAGAIAGAIAAPAAAAAAQPARPANHPPGDASPTGPVIVHVRDVTSGEMDVFAGTSHARLTDPSLAARLVRGVR
jgi:hypothetical protein